MNPWGVIIQVRATEQYFPVVLFIMLYKVVLTFELWMKPQIVTIQMKAAEQYFPVVLSTMPYKVVLAFESVDKTLKCDHSDESYRAVFFCGTDQYAVQGGSNFKIFGWNPKVRPFKWELINSSLHGTICFSTLNKMKFGNFVEFWLSCGIV